MDQIRFKPGEMQSFTATRSFSLGNTGVQIPPGAEIQFDGSTVAYAGTEYSFPNLKGAVKTGWVVPTASYEEGDPRYGRPVSANIQVRHPTQNDTQQRMSIATTSADERVVGDTKAHAEQVREANKRPNRVGMPTMSVEPQDGVAVRTLKTPSGQTAKDQRTVLTGESVGAVLREANTSGRIDPGVGITEAEMLERMPEEDREVYLAEKNAHKSKYVDEAPSPRTKVATMPAKKASGEAEGMKFSNHVGGGVEIADPSGLSGKVKESVITEDGITFKVTNGPEKKAQAHPRSIEGQMPVMQRDGTEDVRRRVATSMCADFPMNYQFEASSKKKLARLQADYDDRPDVLRAVFAAESDEMKAVLVQEFPQAFQG